MSWWVALCPWAGVVPWIPSWQAIWMAAMISVWIGWCWASMSGTLGRVPWSAMSLTAWAGLTVWITLWSVLNQQSAPPTIVVVSGGYSPHGLMDWVRTCIYTRNDFSAVIVLPLVCVWTAVAAVQWMSGWTEQQAARAVVWLRASVMVMVVMGALQAMNLMRFQVDGAHRGVLGGPLGNPTILSCYLAMSVPVLVDWKHWISAVTGVAVAGLLVLCGSMTGMVSALVAAAWCWPRPWSRGARGAAFACLVVMGLLLMVHPVLLKDGFNPRGRFELWHQAIQLWRTGGAQTWVGQGLGSVWAISQHDSPLVAYVHGTHVHNEYLQFLLELGNFGFGLLVWMIISTVRQVMRIPEEDKRLYGGILLASAISASTLFVYHFTSTAVLALFAYSRIHTQRSRA